MQHIITLATNIGSEYLERSPHKLVEHPCIAKKLSWAAHRETTRPEDSTYCLLGLFDVNMPLMYGEGGKKAFLRLQHELVRQSDDDSIFAWTIPDGYSGFESLSVILAPHPTFFAKSNGVARNRRYSGRRGTDCRPRYAITNYGLQFKSLVTQVDGSLSFDLVNLKCLDRTTGKQCTMVLHTSRILSWGTLRETFFILTPSRGDPIKDTVDASRKHVEKEFFIELSRGPLFYP